MPPAEGSASAGRRALRRPRWWQWPLVPFIVVLALASLPLVLIFGIVRWLIRFALLVVVWTTWIPRGRRALVVYSNSSVWQSYFEANVIAPLGDRAVVLNWSERKHWKQSLPVMLFRSFSEGREFNPLVIVFPPYRRPQYFRFYEAFRAYKHGRPEGVEEIRARMFQALDVASSSE
jgi:hypothetical protein